MLPNGACMTFGISGMVPHGLRSAIYRGEIAMLKPLIAGIALAISGVVAAQVAPAGASSSATLATPD